MYGRSSFLSWDLSALLCVKEEGEPPMPRLRAVLRSIVAFVCSRLVLRYGSLYTGRWYIGSSDEDE